MFAEKVDYIMHNHSQQVLCVRYVDNRLVIIAKTMCDHPHIKDFLQDDFYEEPVVLESVTTPDAVQEFLGFDLQMQTYKILLLLREAPWKIRPSASAGTLRQKLAAYQSKKYSILKFVFPDSEKILQLKELKTMFIRAGYQMTEL